MREPVAKAREWIEKNLTTVARIGVIVVFLALAGLAIWLDFSFDDGTQWVFAEHWIGRLIAHGLISVAPELAGIVIGVVTIDYLNERRQDEELKAHLTRDLLSNVTDFAVRAIDELREHGWLEEVIVEKKKLLAASKWQGAALQDVDFERALLERVQLEDAKLASSIFRQAQLGRANLKRANLQKADLEGANLWAANLEGASLIHAKLGGAFLMDVVFKGADLSHADFTGAIVAEKDLKAARTLRGTIMPTGTKLKSGSNRTGPTFEEWMAKREALAEITDGDEEE